MIRLTLCAALLAGAAPASADMIQPGESAALSAESAESQTLNTGEDAVSRMTVPVMVNGKGPFQFVIDTGADRTVISRELADKLGLPDSGKARMVSMGGTDEVRLVKIDRLGVSTSELRHVQAPALAARHLGADGLLGIDSLKNQRIILDFMQATMTLEPSNRREVREEKDPAGTIVVTAKSRLGQLVLVDADANGQGVSVIVDTGGQNSVGNTPLRRLMVRSGDYTRFRTVELISVVGDKIAADYTIVGKMRIGGVQMGNAAVAFADAHPFKAFGLAKRPAMLLGMEGLRAFRRVSIDFANKKVKFLLPTG